MATVKPHPEFPAVIDNSDIGHGDFEKNACIIFCSVVPVFIILRFYSRIVAKQLGVDDWASLAAFTFVMMCNGVTLAAFPHGWGRHKKNLSRVDFEICLILHWVFQITYKMSVALNKASILLLYLRIMPQRYYRNAIYFLLTIVCLFAIATTIAGVFQCIPVYKAWEKHVPGHCYRLVDAWYSNAVFSIITDGLILILPMHMVYKLQRAKREKLLLVAVFGLGSFVTVTSIMRFAYLKSAKNPDTTYDIESGYWSVIEINVGVICVCLPPLHSLLSRHFKFLKQKHTRATGDSSGPYHNGSGNAELVTIGGGNGNGSRNHHKISSKKSHTPEDSEEELVYWKGDGDVVVSSNTPNKTMNFSQKDRRSGGRLGGFDVDVEGGNGAYDERERGIKKTTDFVVTERTESSSESDKDVSDVKRMKPWEHQPHAV